MPNQTEVNFSLTGLEDLKHSLKTKKNVKIGVLGDAGKREATIGKDGNQTKNSMTNAEIGAVHEFGSFSKNVPKRSFLKAPFFEKKEAFLKQMAGIVDRDIGKNNGVDKIYSSMAVIGTAIVQQAFHTSGFGKWAPLSPQTIEKKKSASILIDSGQLRKSITSRIDDE
mgnify:FL=1|jgi:phage gpG-like protein|tara:strand:- start:816 stop:1319 length:504 start_codon:yes stop_codon:yes gene_type:complete